MPKPRTTQTTRPPLPPFRLETAKQKFGLAEDGWNSRDLGVARLFNRQRLAQPIGIPNGPDGIG
jgi:hypothetical protein